MRAVTLMVQGCTSDAGKSAVVTGLCRALYRRGLRVAPFKPQNMALNSAVTVDGGEIGRSQAAQAAACGLEPHSDMNPVLLKPTADRTAQVIVCGRVREDLDARGYQARKRALRAEVLAAHERLAAEHAVIVAEGAGSPAEVNLRADDIANMGFAEAVDCPVLLVADIDRGGVFATLVGTLELLSDSERARVQGVIINRFRGDPSLLDPGLAWFTEYTGKPVLGVLPWLEGLYLEAEDSLARRDSSPDGGFRVAVPALPRISNHTDLDALALTPGVAVSFVGPGQRPPPADLVVLPGSKHVCADLAWLRAQGWPEYIRRHLRYGGHVVGLCGGYQMLGERIDDPDGIEGKAGSGEGLGLLRVTTRLHPAKQLRRVAGRLLPGGEPLTGYEIHMGQTAGPDTVRPLTDLGARREGACSPDGQVLGSYLHGLFDTPEARRALLARCGFETTNVPDQSALREAGIDRLAAAVEQHLDLDALLARIQR